MAIAAADETGRSRAYRLVAAKGED
uniref:Uncharacterized protein n=1 Tax=Musa acuminata subsp. malaccensis TaxID=214687 RepID=A0A804L663_MUSAM